MREIKFRGRCIETGEWLYGCLAEARGKVFRSRYAEKVIFGNLEWFNTDNFGLVLNDCSVDPDTVGQFTGLCDKDGKEIYEGDILKRRYVNYHQEEIFFVYRIGRVEFSYGRFVLCDTIDYKDEMLRTKDEVQPNRHGTFDIVAKASAVIGNIHDNPELLEGGNNESQ